MDDYSADRWNRALDRDAERNKAYGRQESEAEITRLRAELAEAKGNVELFERKYNEWQDCSESLNRQLAEAKCNRITEEQIDAAWEWASLPEKNIQKMERRWGLEKLGIVVCEKCGGTGHVAEEREDGSLKYATGGMPIILDCPVCHERKWVWKGVSDE